MGIGKAGRNDGALLFIALGDRAAEIILGDGVDGPREQARSDGIMASGVVPAFKRGSPDDAVLEGARGLHQLIVSSELNQPASDGVAATARDPAAAENPWAVTENPYGYDPSVIIIGHDSDMDGETNIPAIAGGMGFLGAAGLAGRALLRRRPRRCLKCRNLRTRLCEDSEDAHLEPGQRREEELGSVDYDVWWCEDCEDTQVDRYGTLFTRHARCPKCNFVTAGKTTRTIRSATYDSGGEVEVTVQCKHCPYSKKSRHRTPRRTRSSSSSSSSSSRSSSFGGGRSSGGGSSGRW
ncbi:Glutamate synthase [NADPH] large chain [Myxococcus hansupus]|uniref:Glutamate synthase [NADPH] large chain n=1 Tax=Pseudomyxococcus hansupus TaxID=1297742 RepID=A0A0H4WTN8_9BACT|nr:TPM domain-containing protein [Myxococcus hansupus]AKQ66836.1 Glutamate synthase [NADPH] large chain [Myxococcus hansupus]